MFVPREHLAQLLMQMVVTRLNFAIYHFTGEAGMVSAAIDNCPIDGLEEIEFHLECLTWMLLRWAHVDDEVPRYATDSVRSVLKSRFPFWRVANSYVI